MKNVTRLSKPSSLIKNANTWRDELMAAIATYGNIKKVPDKFFDKYNKPDIKETLKKMYNGVCCYCEVRVGIAEFGNIEHCKPKRIFPRTTYDWDNLNLACTACNEMKGNKYSNKYPILDAVVDNPISIHLKYDYGELGVIYEEKTYRGETTIKHADLNRRELRVARALIFLKALKLKKKMNRNSRNPKLNSIRRELSIMCEEAFGSVINYVMTMNI